MRSLLCASLFLCVAGLSAAQSFECQPLGAFPVGCCDDCEDAWSNNLGTGTGVNAAAACGMPAAGTQYARATADAPYGPGPGIARPIPFAVTEIRVLVPDGADGITLKWNWFNDEAGAEGGGFNDGMEIAIVAPDETTVLVPLVYVDTFSSLAPGNCADPLTGGLDVLSDGVETVAMAFAAVPFGSYLSIVSFNGGDTVADSSGVVDCITWGDPAAPSFERGDPMGPRVVDLTPATSFDIGTPMSVQVRAGNPFVEGFHCCVLQMYDSSSQPQFIVPGIAGGLFLRLNRPVSVVSEGLLSGGVNLGTAGRGPVVSFTINNPALCGAGVLIQAYVITEPLTNPTFTTALFGWLR